MATSYTLVSDRFPDGTIVHANPVDPPHDEPVNATMNGGAATFEGLRDDAEYVAHATVAGQYVANNFRTSQGGNPVIGVLYNVDEAAYPARPDGAAVAMFVGPVEPTIGGTGGAVNDHDLWVPTVVEE
jgi:hypothetical protein